MWPAGEEEEEAGERCSHLMMSRSRLGEPAAAAQVVQGVLDHGAESFGGIGGAAHLIAVRHDLAGGDTHAHVTHPRVGGNAKPLEPPLDGHACVEVGDGTLLAVLEAVGLVHIERTHLVDQLAVRIPRFGSFEDIYTGRGLWVRI